MDEDLLLQGYLLGTAITILTQGLITSEYGRLETFYQLAITPQDREELQIIKKEVVIRAKKMLESLPVKSTLDV